MTQQQLDWLRAHPQHTPVGRAATGVTYVSQGYLRMDGTFSDMRIRYVQQEGDIHVGVKQFTPPGGAPVAREYNER